MKASMGASGGLGGEFGPGVGPQVKIVSGGGDY